MTEPIARKIPSILIGYVSHREFGGFRMPATVQNLVMRDYAQRMKAGFRLSVDEHSFADCYMRLFAILDHPDGIDGVVMCSASMLPNRYELRHSVYEKILTHNVALHFVFENFIVGNSEDVRKTEEIRSFTQILKNCPQSIPADLLPQAREVFRFS